MIVAIIIMVVAIYLLLYAMCRAASADEAQREKMAREWRDYETTEETDKSTKGNNYR